MFTVSITTTIDTATNTQNSYNSSNYIISISLIYTTLPLHIRDGLKTITLDRPNNPEVALVTVTGAGLQRVTGLVCLKHRTAIIIEQKSSTACSAAVRIESGLAAFYSVECGLDPACTLHDYQLFQLLAVPIITIQTSLVVWPT